MVKIESITTLLETNLNNSANGTKYKFILYSNYKSLVKSIEGRNLSIYEIHGVVNNLPIGEFTPLQGLSMLNMSVSLSVVCNANEVNTILNFVQTTLQLLAGYTGIMDEYNFVMGSVVPQVGTAKQDFLGDMIEIGTGAINFQYTKGAVLSNNCFFKISDGTSEETFFILNGSIDVDRLPQADLVEDYSQILNTITQAGRTYKITIPYKTDSNIVKELAICVINNEPLIKKYTLTYSDQVVGEVIKDVVLLKGAIALQTATVSTMTLIFGIANRETME